MAKINATELTSRLVTNKTLEIKSSAEQVAIKENLKNSVKLQLAIAYLFHDKTRAIGDLQIDVGGGIITETKSDGSTESYNIDDNVLDNNAAIPITGLYQTATDASSKLAIARFTADGNFYDGFFSMFDGKATSVPTKKIKKSRKVKK